MKILGARDAWAMAGLGCGIAAASPWFAGDWRAAALGGVAAALGGFTLAYPRLALAYDPVDEDRPEGFVLRSDRPYPPPKERAGVLLGHTTALREEVWLPDEFLVRHAALIGSSGAGKTSLGLWLMWQQLIRGGGLTFIDAKIEADNLASIVYMARALGREADLYVLDISDPDSHTYNPLLYGDADEVASRLLHLIPSAENNPGADHYRQSVNHALTAIVGALKAARRLYHFGDLVVILQSPTALDAVVRMTPPGPERMALEVLLDKYRRPTQNSSSSAGPDPVDVTRLKDTVGGMVGRLALFAQGTFGKITGVYAPEIDLYEVVTNNRILYVRLPTMAKEAAALNFAKMLLSDFRSAVARVQALPRDKRPSPPHLLFADEMGSYVMPGVSRFFEQARSGNIAILAGFQAIGQLREVSPEFADTLMQNTWSKIMFRFGAADSAAQAAEMIGSHRRMAYALSASASSGEGAPFIRAAPAAHVSENEGLGESWRETEEYRVPPSKLAALGVGECVTLIGARMYHLRVPYLRVPVDATREYVRLRHPRRTPPDQVGLDFTRRYGQFLSGAYAEEEAAA